MLRLKIGKKEIEEAMLKYVKDKYPDIELEYMNIHFSKSRQTGELYGTRKTKSE